ncbi:MAG TPA: hypothetical protein PLI77_05735 [Bacteroidales bacterium]|nr:hypothetical protein [Bacteroidales bacterium]
MNSKFLTILLFSFLMCSSHLNQAQTELNWGCFESKHQSKVRFLELDSYQNIYTVDQNSTLSKLNLKGEIIATFGFAKYGTLSSIHVLNPSKMMLFYKDAGIILFLNDQLTPITQPFILFNNNYQNISLATFSNQNQIYLYDQINMKLFVLDFFMREISQNQLNFINFNPSKMFSIYDKGIIMQDEENGVLFFDSFGTYQKQIPLRSTTEFQWMDNKICFFDKGLWNEYDVQKLDWIQYDITKLIFNSIELEQVKKGNQFFVGVDSKGKLLICPQNF